MAREVAAGLGLSARCARRIARPPPNGLQLLAMVWGTPRAITLAPRRAGAPDLRGLNPRGPPLSRLPPSLVGRALRVLSPRPPARATGRCLRGALGMAREVAAGLGLSARCARRIARPPPNGLQLLAMVWGTPRATTLAPRRAGAPDLRGLYAAPRALPLSRLPPTLVGRALRILSPRPPARATGRGLRWAAPRVMPGRRWRRGAP